jgi:hypothetical protein
MIYLGPCAEESVTGSLFCLDPPLFIGIERLNLKEYSKLSYVHDVVVLRPLETSLAQILM